MNMKTDKFDAILYVIPDENDVFEADSRLMTTKQNSATPAGPNGYRIDPALWGSNTFGSSLQSSIGNLGTGWWCEVTDFKKYIVVTVGYHNIITGRTAHKVFLIIFEDKGNGIVMSTMSKWRTISGYAQAASYIISASRALQNETNSKL